MAQHTKNAIRRGFLELLNQRPFDKISVVDIAQVKDLAREGKICDLGGETWAAIGGRDMGAVINDVLYGMPLTIEAKAILTNTPAIEKITGEAFDPLKISDQGRL